MKRARWPPRATSGNGAIRVPSLQPRLPAKGAAAALEVRVRSDAFAVGAAGLRAPAGLCISKEVEPLVAGALVFAGVHFRTRAPTTPGHQNSGGKRL